MDIKKRDALLKRVGDIRKRPLVTLEEFFEGNDDGGSIWCNTSPAPEPAMVYEILRGIRARSDVSDVRVMVTQYDGGEDEWPFSDTIFVVTTASPETVVSWFGDDYAPDEIVDAEPAEEIAVPQGHTIIACWWD
ncbi:MAG TPA: hypothetical protein VMU08_18405 [Rhizomicrobium sp.]|nr:hypothetical protein [Rhizomicrobium sp.]